MRVRPTATFALALGAGRACCSGQSSTPRGAREPAWSPDGKRLAFSYFDRIWIAAADGRNGKPLRPDSSDIERDPQWSADGKSIAFAVDRGQGFDLASRRPAAVTSAR